MVDISTVVDIFDKYGWPGIIALSVIIVGLVTWRLIKNQKKEMSNGFEKIATNITTSINDSNTKMLSNINSQNESLHKSITEQNATLINSINSQNEKLISYFLGAKQQAHDEGMDKRWSVSDEINREVSDLLKVSHATRVSILEFHNGEVNIERLPFLKYSMFYEHTIRGVEGIDERVKGRDASQLRCIVRRLQDNDSNFICLTRKDIEDIYDESPRLSQSLQKLNLSYAIYCGLYSKTNRIMGLVAIEYTKEFPQEIIIKYKQHYVEAAQRIQVHLQYELQSQSIQ